MRVMTSISIIHKLEVVGKYVIIVENIVIWSQTK